MIEKIIDLAAKHRFLVILAWVAIALAAFNALKRTPLDAIPDLSDPQVIVFTEWKGRSPTLIEDQVTYPIASALLSAPKVTAVRGYSMFGMSFVYVLFEEGTDVYWARSRVLEYLSQVQSRLPPQAKPALGPDATGVGWIYQYALADRSGSHDLGELRALQDWFLKYELKALPNVAEVASVGGMVRQYQVVLDPDRLRAYGIPHTRVVAAIQGANNQVFERGLVTARERMLEGEGLALPIQDTRLFQRAATQMMRVGEDTGTLDIQLENAAAYYGQELEYKLKRLTSLFEPAVIIFMGLIVGFVAVALISAMYGVFNSSKLLNTPKK